MCAVVRVIEGGTQIPTILWRAGCRQVLDPSFYDEGWTEEGILDLAVELECEQPDKDLMSFRGRTELQGTNAPPGQQPIQMTQLLLRGCMLKNSGHVLALVVYTGADTRIQMNSAAPPRKMGAFEYFLDTQVAILIVLQLVVCGISAGVSLWWRETKVRSHAPPAYSLGAHCPCLRKPERRARVQGKDRYYLALDDTAGANSDNDFVYWLLTFITFWILYSYFIPNSLFVTIEIIKFALGFIYIPADREMRDPESGEYAQCRNAALNEDLGKVEYIFSDKTGTLTSNEMRLRAIAIKGQPLGDLQLCLEDHPELHGEEAAKKFSAPMHAAMIVRAPTCVRVQRVSLASGLERVLRAGGQVAHGAVGGDAAARRQLAGRDGAARLGGRRRGAQLWRAVGALPAVPRDGLLDRARTVPRPARRGGPRRLLHAHVPGAPAPCSARASTPAIPMRRRLHTLVQACAPKPRGTPCRARRRTRWPSWTRRGSLASSTCRARRARQC